MDLLTPHQPTTAGNFEVTRRRRTTCVSEHATKKSAAITPV
jgi:hypothetical protein